MWNNAMMVMINNEGLKVLKKVEKDEEDEESDSEDEDERRLTKLEET